MAQQEKQRTLTRRTLFLGALKGAAISALAGRLYYLQFIKAGEYTTLAENNRIKLQLVAPERGRILDRLGEPMAVNERNFQLFLDAGSRPRHEVEALLARVSTLVALSEREMKTTLEALKANPYAPPLLVKDHLSWEEVSIIELNQLDLPGVYINTGQLRAYPYAEHSAHLLGYVGAVAPEEINDKQPLLRLPDFKIGKNGVEKMLEDELRGSAGIREIEVNVHGVHVRELGKKPSVPGKDTRLTIHAELQEFTARRLEGESASVVVMDVHSGDVYTLVSMPAYDPNIFSKGIPSAYWKELHDSKYKPLINKSIQGQYPPGSTFKMIMGYAGMREGLIRPGFHVYCPGHFFLGNHRFNCWKEGGHGSVDLHQAIAQSCDTFFYTVAQRIGIEPIADMARLFGLGQTYDIGLIGEKGGLIPDPEWKYKRYKQSWNPGDTINASIGQGYVLATPLQLAVMTARMVGGGYAVKPRLVRNGNAPVFPSLKLNEEHMKAVQEGMEAVTMEPGGTAYGKRILQPEYAMGGKTGTSQVRRIIQRGMDQNRLPWEYRHHALFVGFAPVDAPKYAICVAVEHGGGGSAAAAPVARDVLLKCQEMKVGE